MSHFTVLVFGDNPEKQLEPFDENKEIPRYIKYTKEQLIEKERQGIEKYKNGIYAEYLKDPIAYEADCKNENHVKYLKEEFPKKLNWTEKELYKEALEYYEPEDIGEDGEVYSFQNPNSKWDWYKLGGRWTGMLKLKEKAVGKLGTPGIMTEAAEEGTADQARKGDIDFELMYSEDEKKYNEGYSAFEERLKQDPKMEKFNAYWDYGIENTSGDRKNFIPETREQFLKSRVGFSTLAVVKDGKWYERGQMGWWGSISNEKDDGVWNEEFKNLIDSVSDDTLLSIYDCHI